MGSERHVEFRVDGVERFMIQVLGPADFVLEQLEWLTKGIRALSKKPSMLDCQIDELELSVRTYNALKSLNLLTVSDIVRIDPDDMARIKNFGKKSLTELKLVLSRMGIKWGYQEQEKPNGHQAEETGSGAGTAAD